MLLLINETFLIIFLDSWSPELPSSLKRDLFVSFLEMLSPIFSSDFNVNLFWWDKLELLREILRCEMGELCVIASPS